MTPAKIHSSSGQCRNSFLAFSLGLLVATSQTHAIPQEGDSAITNATLPADDTTNSSLPATDTAIEEIFERDPASTSTPTLQPNPTNPPPLWHNEADQTFKVVGRYSERFSAMNLDEMVAATITNEAILQAQIERIPLDPEAVQNDLGPATNDSELAQLLYQVRKSFSKQRSSASEIQGLRLALSYLAMAAVIIVVIFARR